MTKIDSSIHDSAGRPSLEGGEAGSQRPENGIPCRGGPMCPPDAEGGVQKPEGNAKEFPEIAEVKKLLGPLVNPLLRQLDGSLDLSKVSAKNFSEFKQFLITQVKVDGISFNQHLLDSYHKVLGKKEYEPLLRVLFDESVGADPRVRPDRDLLSGGRHMGLPLQDILKKFQSDLISVSAEHFVRNYLPTPEGRDRLRHVLGDASHYTKDLRADVIKALNTVGSDQRFSRVKWGELGNYQSTMDYFNVTISDEDLTQLTGEAQKLLRSADWKEAKIAQGQNKYFTRPEEVRVFENPELKRAITSEVIREMAAYYEEKMETYDSISEFQAKLSRFWLFLIDRESALILNDKEQAWLIETTEALLEKTKSIQTEKDFEIFNEEMQEFLHGYLKGEGEGIGNWFEHKMVGNGLEELCKFLAPTRKASHTELQQLSDEWAHSIAMGVKVRIQRTENREQKIKNREQKTDDGFQFVGANLVFAPDDDGRTQGSPLQAASTVQLHQQEDPIENAKSRFIHGLAQSIRSLCYGFKQKKAIARGIAQIADKPMLSAIFLGAPGLIGGALLPQGEFGKLAEINKANAELEGMIQRLEQAQTKEEIEKEFQNLYENLKEEGVLHKGFAAAEVDGADKLYGLVQTIGIILGTAVVLRGVGTSKAVAQATEAVTAAETIPITARVAYGAKMGAWIPAAENILAISTGEVRPGSEKLIDWGIDSGSTALAMGLVTPMAMGLGGALHRNVLRGIFERYTTGGIRGAGRIFGDGFLELPEEMIDQSANDWAKGKSGAISFDQFREIGLITSLGGGTKVGAVAQGFHSVGANLVFAPDENGRSQGSPLQNHPLRSAAKQILLNTTLLLMGGIPGEVDGRVATEAEKLESWILAESGDPQKDWPELWEKYQGLADALGFDPSQDNVREARRFFLEELGPHHPLIPAIIQYESHKLTNQMYHPKVLYFIQKLGFILKIGLHRFETKFPGFVYETESVSKYLKYCWETDFTNLDFNGFLELVLEATEDSDAVARHFAFLNISLFVGKTNKEFPPELREKFLELAYRGLKDPFLPVVEESFNILKAIAPDAAKKITESDLPSQASTALGKNLHLKIKNYFYHNSLENIPRNHLFNQAMRNFEISGNKSITIRSLIPVHSLADHNPDDLIRSPEMAKKYALLKSIVTQEDQNRENVLARFFTQDDEIRWPPVLEIEPGRYYLMDCHHRIAALIQGARDGIIPWQWIEEPLPVKIYHNPVDYPPAYFRYLITHGVDLTWKDLFPGDVQWPPEAEKIFDVQSSTEEQPTGENKNHSSLLPAMAAGWGLENFFGDFNLSNLLEAIRVNIPQTNFEGGHMLGPPLAGDSPLLATVGTLFVSLLIAAAMKKKNIGTFQKLRKLEREMQAGFKSADEKYRFYNILRELKSEIDKEKSQRSDLEKRYLGLITTFHNTIFTRMTVEEVASLAEKDYDSESEAVAFSFFNQYLAEHPDPEVSRVAVERGIPKGLKFYLDRIENPESFGIRSPAKKYDFYLRLLGLTDGVEERDPPFRQLRAEIRNLWKKFKEEFLPKLTEEDLLEIATRQDDKTITGLRNLNLLLGLVLFKHPDKLELISLRVEPQTGIDPLEIMGNLMAFPPIGDLATPEEKFDLFAWIKSFLQNQRSDPLDVPLQVKFGLLPLFYQHFVLPTITLADLDQLITKKEQVSTHVPHLVGFLETAYDHHPDPAVRERIQSYFQGLAQKIKPLASGYKQLLASRGSNYFLGLIEEALTKRDVKEAIELTCFLLNHVDQPNFPETRDALRKHRHPLIRLGFYKMESQYQGRKEFADFLSQHWAEEEPLLQRDLLNSNPFVQEYAVKLLHLFHGRSGGESGKGGAGTPNTLNSVLWPLAALTQVMNGDLSIQNILTSFAIFIFGMGVAKIREEKLAELMEKFDGNRGKVAKELKVTRQAVHAALNRAKDRRLLRHKSLPPGVDYRPKPENQVRVNFLKPRKKVTPGVLAVLLARYGRNRERVGLDLGIEEVTVSQWINRAKGRRNPLTRFQNLNRADAKFLDVEGRAALERNQGNCSAAAKELGVTPSALWHRVQNAAPGTVLAPFKKRLQHFPKLTEEELLPVLKKNRGNKTRTAKELKVGKSTVHRMIRKASPESKKKLQSFRPPRKGHS